MNFSPYILLVKPLDFSTTKLIALVGTNKKAENINAPKTALCKDITPVINEINMHTIINITNKGMKLSYRSNKLAVHCNSDKSGVVT